MVRRLWVGLAAAGVLTAGLVSVGAAPLAAQVVSQPGVVEPVSERPLVQSPVAIPTEPVTPFVVPKIVLPVASQAEVVLGDVPAKAGSSPISVALDKTTTAATPVTSVPGSTSPTVSGVPSTSTSTSAVPSASSSTSSSVTAGSSTSTTAVDAKAVPGVSPVGGRVGVEVLDQAKVRSLGAQGLAFRLVAADAKAAGAPVSLSIDYSGFREAFGGDWASRLQVLRWPDCVLTTPDVAACSKPSVVSEVVNDLSSSTLRVKVAPQASLVGLGSDKLGVASRGAQPDLGVLNPVMAPWKIPAGEALPVPVIDPKLPKPAAGESHPTAVPSPVGEVKPVLESSPPASDQPAVSPVPLPGPSAVELTPPVVSKGAGQSPSGVGRAAAFKKLLLFQGGGSGVFGLSGAQGSYAATDLRAAAKWDVGLSAGNFTWSYPVVSPPATAGPAPEVSVAYSSQSVDGMTSPANNQPSVAGLGFNLAAGGFIQRGYVSCSDPRIGGGTTDQCWLSNNATISLGGVSSELVPTDSTYNEWRLRDDNGWRVQRVLGGEVAALPHPDAQTEYWVVTDQKGTRYYFGRYYDLTNLATNPTGSVWTVPVRNLTDPAGPCYLSYCAKAWRWNLDLVVDRPGNSEALFWTSEVNNYGFGGAPNTLAYYARGGVLSRIEYGRVLLPNSTSGPSKQKIEFGYGLRCIQGGYTPSLCDPVPPTLGNASSYPDTPTDLFCWAAPCYQYSPSFFTANRLALITTYVVEGAGWRPVDQVRLNHEWPANSDGSQQKMWLRSVQHIGYSAGTSNGGTDATGTDNIDWLPSVQFDSTANLPNRYDVNIAAGVLPMNMFRLTKITDELGATTTISYNTPHPCTGMPATGWQDNTKDCYPAYWVPPAGPAGFAIFNKYLVTAVSVADSSGMASPTQSWSYSYNDTPAWRYDDNPLAYWATQSYGQWRGHSKVNVTQGNRTTRHTFLRGMDAMPLPAGGTRAASVTSQLDGGVTVVDSDPYAGHELDSSRLKPGGGWNDGSINTWFTPRSLWGASSRASWMVKSVSTKNWFWEGALNVPRNTETVTAYEGTWGRVTAVEERGRTDISGDERCTQTMYPTPTNTTSPMPTPFVVDVPSQTVLYATTCNAIAGQPIQGSTLYWYNFSQVIDPNSQPAPNWPVITRSVAYQSLGAHSDYSFGYDAAGRQTQITDPYLHTTTTAYDSVYGYPKTVTKALGLSVTTDRDPGRGVPILVTDANSRQTRLCYDPLGRLALVYRPYHKTPTGATPSPCPAQQWAETNDPASYAFGYDVPDWNPARTAKVGANNLPPGVNRAQTYEALGVGYRTSWKIIDGNGLTRENQTPGPDLNGNGNLTDDQILVSAVKPNIYGETDRSTDPINVSGSIGTPLTTGTWPPAGAAQTIYTYDEIGRVTNQSTQTAAVTETTSTTYLGSNGKTVYPPNYPNADATSYWTDSYGRLAQVREWNNSSTTVADSFYTYSVQGDLDRVTDPQGNVTDTDTNWLGWRTKLTDPDQGISTFVYDNVGNLTSSTVAGQTVANIYDAVDRRVGQRQDSAAGALIATWTYGTVGAAADSIGRLLSETSYQDPDGTGTASQYVTNYGGYDARGRLLTKTYTLPTGEGFPGSVPGTGTYTYNYTYNRADQPVTTTYPQAGGLGQETVTQTYDAVGKPDTLASPLGTYVTSTRYDTRGRIDKRTMANTTNPLVKDYNFDDLGRLTDLIAATTDPPTSTSTVQNEHYAWNTSNVLTSITDNTQPVAQRECFQYEGRLRLTAGWTTLNTTCQTTRPSPVGVNDGVDPYTNGWTYNNIGNMTVNVEIGTYTYNAAKPHAVTAAGLTSYTYNPNGTAATRTVSGVTTTFTWDYLSRLTKTKVGANNPTIDIYGASNQRLIRRNPDTSKTLYLENQEINRSTTGTITATRYYNSGGANIAIRANNNALTWTLANHQGTLVRTVANGATTATVNRYRPYGTLRTATTPNPFDSLTDRGFLGQTKEPTTNLIYLNNRYYDPTIGKFLSVDPFANPTNSNSLNPYVYGLNAPTIATDPSGLEPHLPGVLGRCEDGTGSCEPAKKAAAAIDAYAHGQLSGSSDDVNTDRVTSYYGGGTLGEVTHEAGILATKATPIAEKALQIEVAGACGLVGAVFTGGTAGLTAASACASAVPRAIENAIEGRTLNDGITAKSVAIGIVTGVAVGSALNAITGGLATEASATGAATNSVDDFADDLAGAVCHSFDRRTEVLMADGTRRQIGDVKIGDRVRTTDPKTGNTVVRPVTALHVNRDTDLADLTVRDADGHESTIHTTQHHRFWDDSRHAWVEAGELEPGERLHDLDGDAVTVAGVLSYDGLQTMYDLTVDGVHTYYIEVGNSALLVHNCNLGSDIVDHIGSRSLNGVDDLSRTSYIEDLIHENPLAQHRVLNPATGRQAWWDPIKENVVIDDGLGGGTAFHRPGGADWFWEVLE